MPLAIEKVKGWGQGVKAGRWVKGVRGEKGG